MPKIAHAKRIEHCGHGGCRDQATHHCADCRALRCAAHAAHECRGAAAPEPPAAPAASLMQFSPAAQQNPPQEPEQPCETTSAAD